MHIHHTHKKYSYTRGLTIIESLVAIVILMTAVTGPLVLMSQTITSARISKDRLRATYLAQEGIELVRYKRDRDALLGTGDWLEGLGTCVDSEYGCQLHPITGSVTECDELGCVPLGTRPDGTLVPDVSLPESAFTRTVLIIETVPGEEATVESIVTWEDAGGTREVTLQEVLRPWSGS